MEKNQQRNATLAPFEQAFKVLLKENKLLEDKISRFMEGIRERYPPSQAVFIQRAVILGTVAHQNNEQVEKRFRKEVGSDGKPLPYFVHPLEMAERMAMPPNDEPSLDWITIVSTLLHDVPEDVKLNKIENKEQWFLKIEEVFADTGYQHMIVNIIDGVTERKLASANSGPEARALHERLEKTPMYQMITGFVDDGGLRGLKNKQKKDIPKDPWEKRKVKEKIAGIVYNLEYLFAAATNTPADLRIFAIKIADLWHNLQSPDWIKDDKKLRGRIAANLADYMGWFSMRDEIISSLSTITDVSSPFTPQNSRREFFSKSVAHLARNEMSRCTDTSEYTLEAVFKYLGLPIQYSLLYGGYPVPTTNTQFVFTLYGTKTTLPQPEVRSPMAGEYVKNIKAIFSPDIRTLRVSIPSTNNKSRNTTVTIIHDTSLIEKMIKLFGRDRVDLTLSEGSKLSFTLRIEDDQPHIIDMFMIHEDTDSSIMPESIPEYALLRNPFMFENEELLSVHLQSLIGFFYEPNLIGQVGPGVIPLFHKASGRFFFLPKQLTLLEASIQCGLPELQESPSNKTVQDLYGGVSHKLALKTLVVI